MVAARTTYSARRTQLSSSSLEGRHSALLRQAALGQYADAAEIRARVGGSAALQPFAFDRDERVLQPNRRKVIGDHLLDALEHFEGSGDRLPITAMFWNR